jgi:hypothetical protein
VAAASNVKFLQDVNEKSTDSFIFKPHAGSNNHLWSSGLSRPQVCKKMLTEANAPIFISFLEIPVPALIFAMTSEDMACTAYLYTRATPQQLLAWGLRN